MKASVVLLVVAMFISVLPARAQQIDSAKAYLYASGADPSVATPVVTANFIPSITTCNLTPIALTAPAVNPTNLYWNDTVNAGKQCRVAINFGQQGGLGVAPGTYDLRMTTTIVGTESAKSSAFAVQIAPPPPPVPSNVGAK